MLFDDVWPVEPFRALSIQQPWAELIMSGRKSIEVRTWWNEYRGPLWIHVGKKADAELCRMFDLSDAYRGGFVGRVTLSTIVQFDETRWNRWSDRHLSVGPMPAKAYGFVLKDPIRLREPVDGGGELGLFKITDDLSRTLEALLPRD